MPTHMYVVYILLCNDNSLYTGITNDMPRRFEMHKNGTASKYTRSRGVRKILYTEKRRTKGSALRREAAIKQLSRAQKLQLVAAAKAAAKKSNYSLSSASSSESSSKSANTVKM